MRIGHGYDVHRLVEGRPLILGGVTVPYEKGLLGHSDADVLAHVIMDALLGAAALGDIGKHFPDTDPQYKGADSLKLLENVAYQQRKREGQQMHKDAALSHVGIAASSDTALYLLHKYRPCLFSICYPLYQKTVALATNLQPEFSSSTCGCAGGSSTRRT